jgi:hypothetical protein
MEMLEFFVAGAEFDVSRRLDKRAVIHWCFSPVSWAAH